MTLVEAQGSVKSTQYVIAVMCGAQALTTLGAFAFPALLPVFFGEWNLDATEAGWIAGIYFGGYAVSVPILVSLTDRVDARLVFGASAFLTAAAWTGFAAIAEGFWTALIFQVLAGTYMPGLRVLTDRYRGPRQPRAIAFYTASFSLGTGLSFLVAGALDRALGWQAAFAAVVVVSLGPARPERAAARTALLDFRPVLRNRPAMGYMLAYGAHAWELLGMRAWLVAFLAFSLSLGEARGAAGAGWMTPTTVAAFSALVAVAASIGGQELAARFGRRRFIACVMAASAVGACFFGFAAALPYAAVVAAALLYSAAV